MYVTRHGYKCTKKCICTLQYRNVSKLYFTRIFVVSTSVVRLNTVIKNREVLRITFKT